MQGTYRSGEGEEQSLLCDPGSELRVQYCRRVQDKKGEDNEEDEKQKKEKKKKIRRIR